MCGFVAFLSSAGELDPVWCAPEAWRALIRHRGPDAEDSYVAAGVAMHFTRLSILDLSANGMQPMRSQDGRYVMVFNGEIVNSRELAAQYRLPVRSRSDSEVLLELYAAVGDRVGALLRGMFAFVIYDMRERTAVGYRDPFGIKPFYYAEDPRGLIMASEITPILRALDGADLDEEAICRFLRRGRIDDGPSTLYHRVKQLLPGHRLIWRHGVVSVAPYRRETLSPMDDVDEPFHQAAYYHQLRQTVGEYLYADVPVGVSLSGGFDSSLLAHLVRANREAGQRVVMLTRGYHGYEGNEVEAARGVAERYGFDHHTVMLSADDIPALLQTCSEAQEHPITSISILAFHQLYRAARVLGVPVLLEGHGGDELWAGYASYLDADMDREGQSHDGSSFALNDEVIMGSDAVCDDAVSPWLRMGAEPSPLLACQLADLFGAKLQRSLRFVDRASMQASVEVRVPFLDTAVALPALRCPDAWKIRDGALRSFVRHMARPHLGDGVAWRPKVPVQDPQRAWLQVELKAFMLDQLHSHTLFISRFVDMERLRRLYASFLATPSMIKNVTCLVFPLFLEAWYQAMKRHAVERRLMR